MPGRQISGSPFRHLASPLAIMLERFHSAFGFRAMAEERRQALLVCLAAKFGALPVAVHQRVRSADAATCDAWLDRVTLAGSLAEVLSEA